MTTKKTSPKPNGESAAQDVVESMTAKNWKQTQKILLAEMK